MRYEEFEEEQTKQWPKEKVQKEEQRSTTHTYHDENKLHRYIFSLTLYCCMLGREATNTNFIVIGLSRPDPEPMIYQKKKET